MGHAKLQVGVEQAGVVLIKGYLQSYKHCPIVEKRAKPALHLTLVLVVGAVNMQVSVKVLSQLVQEYPSQLYPLAHEKQ